MSGQRKASDDLYIFLISVKAIPNGLFTLFSRIPLSSLNPMGEGRVRPPLYRWRGGGAPALRRLCRALEARLTMLMILLYGAGAVAVAVYMVAALVFPEKF
jgi:hypothetical protein